MKKARISISIVLAVVFLVSMLPCYAVFFYTGDVTSLYCCSFDIPIDATFATHPVYNYADNGILHVRVLCGGSLFVFGTEKTIAVEANQKTGVSGFGEQGEWVLFPDWTTEYLWDSEKHVTSDKGLRLQCVNFREKEIYPPLGNSNGPELCFDMIEDTDGLTIRAYLQKYNSASVSGVVKPTSTVTEYIPSSFEEFRGKYSDTGKTASRLAFKRNGKYANAIEGTEEAAALEKEREDLLASLTDPTETKVVEYERKDPELIENLITNKEEATDTENDKKTDNKAETTQKNIPEALQGLTKEESIENHGYYFDESGNEHGCFFYDGINNGLQFKNELLNKFEFTVPGNFAGVSSDGKTKFTMYHIGVRQYIASTGKMRPIPLLKLTLMQVSGNLGEKMYQGDSHVWHIPDTMTVFGFPDLDNQSALYGWNEVVDITDEYVDTIQGEEGDFTVRYTNDARTGIESITFDLPGFSKTIPFEQIDYIGGFLQFFLPSAYGDTWADKAVEIGLTPQESEAE